MKWLPVALLLTGCSPTRLETASARCVTRCGLQAPTGCSDLQGVEDRAVEAFGRIPEWGGPARVCLAFRGWGLVAHAHRESDEVACGKRGWVLYSGLCVLGFTHEGARRVELTDTDWSKGVVAHELVHVLDIEILQRAGHCAWKERGVKEALLRIQGFEDDSENVCP